MSSKQSKESFTWTIFLISLSNVDELIELSKRVISGFRLTKWVTNSFAISSSLPKTEISPKLVSPAVERALGMIWYNNQDKLTFKPATKDYPNTKPGILSLVSSVLIHWGIWHQVY